MGLYFCFVSTLSIFSFMHHLSPTILPPLQPDTVINPTHYSSTYLIVSKSTYCFWTLSLLIQLSGKLYWGVLQIPPRTFKIKSILCVCVLVAQSCLTLCDPIDCSPPGILQARILEWVAISFSRNLFSLKLASDLLISVTFGNNNSAKASHHSRRTHSPSYSFPLLLPTYT